MVSLEPVLSAKEQDAQRHLPHPAQGYGREADEVILKRLIERHFKHTGSTRARLLLDNWAEAAQVRQGLPERIQTRAGRDGRTGRRALIAPDSPAQTADRTY
jgi:glutamate synthase domain-containing protein 3